MATIVNSTWRDEDIEAILPQEMKYLWRELEEMIIGFITLRPSRPAPFFSCVYRRGHPTFNTYRFHSQYP